MDNIVFQALVWQFYDMPLGIMKGWKTFLLFNLNYFSVPDLIKTYLSPWRRYSWSYPRGLNPKAIFETLVSNIFSRILGAILRLGLIILGVISQLVVVIGGAVVFVIWLALPFLCLLGLLFFFVG